MSTPVNIIIDNKTVLDNIVSCEIQQREGQFCRTVSLQFSSQSFWALCDPAINFGELRIKVVIGNTTYEFLAEERDSDVSTSGVAFSVWGRSEQALLARPYSENINDTDDTSHPWQTGNTTASAIISHIVTNYCPYSVTINWNVDDFAVYEDTFSVSNQAPIDIISALANVVGAELKANADGSLSIEEYSVEEGTSLTSYTDLDDITQLNESIDYPSGYNAVTVYGYDSGAGAGDGGGGAGASPNAHISVVDENVDSTTCQDEEHLVKVFYYHPTLAPLCSFPDGSYGARDSGTESITETVTLIWGRGNTRYPNLQGSTIVTGSTSIPITTTSVTYTARYKRFYLKASSVGSHTAMFYFSDQSDYSTYSFTVSDCSEEWDALFDDADADGDGILTCDEWSDLFNKLDSNSDGFIDEDEWLYNNELFDAIDTNRDGKITEDEWDAYYSTIDTDGDCEIDELDLEDSGYAHCESIVVEKESPDTVVPGDAVYIRVYGEYRPNDTAGSGGSAPSIVTHDILERKTENIVFTNGTASLSYPLLCSRAGATSPVVVTFSGQYLSNLPVLYKQGSKQLVINELIDHSEVRYYSVPASVTYYTSYFKYRVNVPSSYDSTTFVAVFGFESCSTAALNITISSVTELTKDITITVGDNASDVDIEGVSVLIDGRYRGLTDSNGELDVAGVSVGDHSIKMTKSGYIDSDLDSLANDIFTVT